jgi:hypothetical protein
MKRLTLERPSDGAIVKLRKNLFLIKSVALSLCRTVVLNLTWIIFIISGCSSTFLVSKDGKGYFFGSKSDAIYRMLCDSGDLRKILKDATKIKEDTKDAIYQANCVNRSGEKVKEIYAAMTPEERKDLRNAFKLNGYDINYMPC